MNLRMHEPAQAVGVSIKFMPLLLMREIEATWLAYLLRAELPYLALPCPHCHVQETR
jgi:hypothetical protein